MVGSTLAAVLAGILLLGTVEGNDPCDGVDPQHQNFTHAFTNYSCLYIRLPLNPRIDWTTAKEECEKLGGSGYPHEWRLVEPKTMAMHKELERILLPMSIGRRHLWCWAGLVRDQAESGDNDSTWGDPTKWRWLSDNTTLNSFDGQPPWKPPDPNGYPTGNCLLVVVFPPLGWYDAACSRDVYGRYDQMLVCELIDVTMTTTSTTTETTTETTASATTETTIAVTSMAKTSASTRKTTAPANHSSPVFELRAESTSESSGMDAKKAGMWVGIGLSITVIVVAAFVGGYYGYKRYRKRRLRKLGIRHESATSMFSADSDQSGTYENMRRYKKKKNGKGKSMRSKMKTGRIGDFSWGSSISVM